MLKALMDAAQLRPYFEGFVSVDEVKIYKPSPRVYRHVTQRLGGPVGEIRLVSSNLFDSLGSPPEIVVGTLTELAD
jgi:2-haloacid dehalogenase